jgi:uncharacterized protein (TIGR04255 family)
MSKFESLLPEYESPPVREVVLSLQFEPVNSLRSPQLGLVWNIFRKDFPGLEEHPPIAAVTETFGQSASDRLGLQIEMTDMPLLPRLWLLNEMGTELIQIQQDRFIHNWRKTGDGQVYPRYDYIRKRFRSEFETLTSFLTKEGIPPFVINQCEVTYINHIVAGDVWKHHSELSKVLSPWSGSYSDDFLAGGEEDANMNLRYRITGEDRKPIGRLHVKVQPAYRKSDHAPMFVLTLTARGRPNGDGVEGAFNFLDIGREWIVRGFTSLTTQELHKVWRRKR